MFNMIPFEGEKESTGVSGVSGESDVQERDSKAQGDGLGAIAKVPEIDDQGLDQDRNRQNVEEGTSGWWK